MNVQWQGEGADIGSEVRTALSRGYASDRATGIANGEVRAYFLVEAPEAD